MMIKSWGFLILFISFTAAATTNNKAHSIDYKTKSFKREIASNLHKNENKTLNAKHSENSEVRRLKNRISRLKTLRQIISYRHHGSKIFPYDSKIKALERHLSSITKQQDR